MAKLKLHGNPINTSGALPRLGAKAKDFVLTDNKLQDVSLANFTGKKILLNIYPSIDTGVCAMKSKRLFKLLLKSRVI